MNGRMTRILLGVFVCALLLGGVCLAEVCLAEDGTTFSEVVQVLDWGPSPTKLVIDAGETLTAQHIDLAAFTVHVTVTDDRQDVPLLGEGERIVTDIYVSDAEGNRVDTGAYLTLALHSEMDDGVSLAMDYDMNTDRRGWVDRAYVITQHRDIGGLSGQVITERSEILMPDLAPFDLTGTFDYTDAAYGDLSLGYASYTPVGAYEGADLPLIIWIHGGGEGGTDMTIPLSANKACAFATEPMQAHFGGAAYVLAPQTPTSWVLYEDIEIPEDLDVNEITESTSRYTDALKALIDQFIAENPAIDTDRIYIGGCSNGGYMTMVMILKDPDFYAAAFPVCEAMYDYTITDDALATIADMPLFFVHAAIDSTIPAWISTLPTYDRLIKLGAENTQLYYPAYVEDVTGVYGDGYRFPGHWSWIYVYNNDVPAELGDKTVTLMQWLAAQSK